MTKTYLLLALLSTVAALPTNSVPQWPNSYLVEGSMALKPVGTPEIVFNNFSVYYDTEFGTRVSFDSDEAYTIQSVAAQFTWQLIAAKDHMICVATNNSGPTNVHTQMLRMASGPLAAMALQPGLPDMTNFTFAGQVRCPELENSICNQYEWVWDVSGKVASYDLYTLTDGTPLQWEMLGVNMFETSHYDHYVMRYRKYIPGYKNKALVAMPEICADSAIVQTEVKHTGAYHLHNMVPSAVHQEYRNFISSYKRTYSPAEYDQRLLHFTKNFMAVKDHQANQHKHTYTVKLNHFADRSEAELRTMTGLKSALNPGAEVYQKSGKAAPAAMDWRVSNAVSPVKDQGLCGSCWAFSTTGALESANFIKTGNMKLLSEQMLVDCAWNGYNMGCDGGFQWAAYKFIMDNKGVPTDISYGSYKMINEYCHYQNGTQAVSVAGYVNVTAFDESALIDAIATVGPVAVSIDATLPMYFYHDGVYYNPDCGNTINDLDHAVLAVGYGTEDGQDYWLIKNSWSTYWGHFGYIKMARKNNNCGVATAPVFPRVQ